MIGLTSLLSTLAGVIMFCCMVVWCLENHWFIYFVQFHSYFRHEGKSGPHCSIMARTGSLYLDSFDILGCLDYCSTLESCWLTKPLMVRIGIYDAHKYFKEQRGHTRSPHFANLKPFPKYNGCVGPWERYSSRPMNVLMEFYYEKETDFFPYNLL